MNGCAWSETPGCPAASARSMPSWPAVTSAIVVAMINDELIPRSSVHDGRSRATRKPIQAAARSVSAGDSHAM